jgi:transposase
MRKIRSADHLTDEELAERMEISENKKQFRRWQAVYLIQTQELSSAQVAEIVRVKSGTVLQRVYLYNNNGEEILTFRGSGGRRRCHMSHDEEISFPEESEKEACKGSVITAKRVRQRVEEKSGHEVSEDYAYDLPHRHLRKKKSPRPCHPKADKSRQEEYEKNFRIWLEKRQKHSVRMINGRLKSSPKMKEDPVVWVIL